MILNSEINLEYNQYFLSFNLITLSIVSPVVVECYTTVHRTTLNFIMN